MDELTQELPANLRKTIRSRLLRVHSKFLENQDLQECLRECYDVYAGLLNKVRSPLTEEVLTERIPGWVYEWAVEHKWVLPPDKRYVVAKYGSGGTSHVGTIPARELVEPLGRFRVAAWCKTDITNCLASRVAYWQAEAESNEVEASQRTTRSVAEIQVIGSTAIIDASFWRTLRLDFEGLQTDINGARERDRKSGYDQSYDRFVEFTLSWSTEVHQGEIGRRSYGNWAWTFVPDESLRVRIEALAKRAARGLGYLNFDAWFDALRLSPFVGFKLSGSRFLRGPLPKPYSMPEGVELRYEFGDLTEIVKHSITLCHALEADSEGAEAVRKKDQLQIVPTGTIDPPRKTPLGAKIDGFRRECGWSFDDLAKESGLDKKLILGHINQGKGTHPRTVKIYADTFARRLGREVTVADLEA